jgi:hypothetical protein
LPASLKCYNFSFFSNGKIFQLGICRYEAVFHVKVDFAIGHLQIAGVIKVEN